MVGLVLIGVFVLMLILNVPVGISLGIASLVTVLANPSIGASDTYIVQNLVTAIDSFPLMAVPFFVLAGELMSGGGISKRLLNTFNCFFGRITGGLAIVAVVACMFFAAISGSGPATVAAIGGMVLPTMIEKGYDRKFILGLLAAAGCIGVIIPPSIPMVIYGVSTNASITDLFLAGFIPGIVIGLALIAVAYFISKKHGWRDQDLHMTGKEKLKIIWEAKWALIAPVIVLGGIYGGIFTPTEAAAVSCIYSFVVGMFVYREASLRDIGSIIKNSCLTTGTILIVTGSAAAFSKVLSIGQIPQQIASLMTSFTDSKIVLLILINIMLLIVGCFMETLCSIMILAPLFLPIVDAFGIDPIQFGIIMVVNLAIGFITPPLGVNLFVAVRIGNSTLEDVVKGIIPFLLVMVLVLLLITYIPQISMFLPNLFD